MMRRTVAGRVVALVFLTLLAWGCRTTQGPSDTAQKMAGPNAGGPADKAAGPGSDLPLHFAVTGVPLGDDLFVGPGRRYDNLTVFPILAASQTDVGPLISLHEALEKGDAEVRELDAGNVDPEPVPGDGQATQLNQAQGGGAAAQVGTLAIQNKGDVPVYVLGGTIVKGGKQDRQVGQDFIIGAKQTVPIDAFCVEHGRWDENRGGKATGGKFEVVKQLANSSVRVAGQYEGDQGAVWSKVAKVNAANKKHSSSDSLLATADDDEIKQRRDVLGERVRRDLTAIEPAESVVGYAYAVDGEVRAVRWFAHHRVYRMFREMLVNTAIVDAYTASAAEAESTDSVAKEVRPEAVAKFIADAKETASAPEERATQGANTNVYSGSTDAYHSTTTIEFSDDSNDADPHAKRPKKKVKMSVDFVKKK